MYDSQPAASLLKCLDKDIPHVYLDNNAVKYHFYLDKYVFLHHI